MSKSSRQRHTSATQPKPSEIVRTMVLEAAQAIPLVVLGPGSYVDLLDELGTTTHTLAYVVGLAEQIGRPIGLVIPGQRDTQSLFVAPPDWSRERLQGFVAGFHHELESVYGPATVVA